MIIDKEKAVKIKSAVDYLHESPFGKELLELLECMGGKYRPSYNPESESTILIAAGRTEVIQTIRNLHRLDVDQIVECYKGKSI